MLGIPRLEPWAHALFKLGNNAISDTAIKVGAGVGHGLRLSRLVVGCSCCCNPGHRRDRGVQAASAFAGNRNATPSSRFFSAKRRLRLGRKALVVRRGAAPPSTTGGSRGKSSPPAGGK